MFESLKALLEPPKGMQIDFTQPKGAKALAPENGISWEIFANPVALYIGGITAVILELTEPSIGSGVWDHSNFKTDPFARLQRTGYAAMVTVYAPRDIAKKMIAHVVKMHDHVRGININGEEYYANDPQLLDWVQSTAVFGFTQAYSTFVRQLSTNEYDLAFQEAQASAHLYGAKNLPQSWQEWQFLLENTIPNLRESYILEEFIQIMLYADILPKQLKWLQKIFVKAAIEITPEPIRSLPQLKDFKLSFFEKCFFRIIAKLNCWIPLSFLSPAQAKQRMK